MITITACTALWSSCSFFRDRDEGSVVLQFDWSTFKSTTTVSGNNNIVELLKPLVSCMYVVIPHVFNCFVIIQSLVVIRSQDQMSNWTVKKHKFWLLHVWCIFSFNSQMQWLYNYHQYTFSFSPFQKLYVLTHTCR